MGLLRIIFFANAAALPSFQLTDAGTTASSAIVTSTSGQFNSVNGFVVGRSVGVLGAGPNAQAPSAPGSMYGTIVSVDSATQITLSDIAVSSVSGKTLSVFPARDSNIKIRGGHWIGKNKDSRSQNLSGHGALIRRVNGFSWTDEPIIEAPGAHQGGQYQVSLGDVTNVYIPRMHFPTTPSDGLHVQGPANGIFLGTITGTTGDDTVAFTQTDGQTQSGSLLGDVYGSILNVNIDVVRGTSSSRVLLFSAGSGASSPQETTAKVGLVAGTGVNGGLMLSDYAGGNGSLDVTAGLVTAASPSAPQVQITCSSLRYLKAKVAQDYTYTGSQPQVNMNSNGTVSFLDLDLTPGRNGTTGAGLVFSTTGAVRMLRLAAHVEYPNFVYTPLVIVKAGSTLEHVVIHDSKYYGSSNIVQMNPNSPVMTSSLIDIVDCEIPSVSSGGFVYINATPTAVQYINIKRSRYLGTKNAIASKGGAVVSIDDSVSAPGGAVVMVSVGSNKSKVAWRNSTLLSGNLTSITAPSTLSMQTDNSVGVDVSTLSPNAGDIANNSNATLGCGTGLVISDGTHWKNLYTGVATP